MIIYEQMDQRSPEWFEARCGIPTASEFKNIVSEKALLKSEIVKRLLPYGEEAKLDKMKVAQLNELAIEKSVDLSANWVISENEYHNKLAAEIIANTDPDPWLGNNDTEHGNDWEKLALKRYAEETGYNVQAVGFITDDLRTMGASPDALVNDEGLAEVKSTRGSNLVRIYNEWIKTKETPKEFKVQVNGQLMLSEREWCDLILSHPLIGQKTIRFTPDKKLIATLKEAVEIVSQKRDEAVSMFAGI